MYIKVMYFKPEVSGYAGQSYLYKTTLPVQIGSKVIAPTYKGAQKAIVTEKNVDASEIKPAWADKIRSIEEFDIGVKEEQANG